LILILLSAHIKYVPILPHAEIPIITKQPLSKRFRNRDKTITTLECAANGTGNITYQWEKYQATGNHWTKPSTRVMNNSLPKLTFSVIREEDEGVYRCKISNHDGSVVTDNATITVYGEQQCCE